MIFKTSLFRLLFLTLMATFIFSSCYKKQDTIVIIKVNDSVGDVVIGANVQLVWLSNPQTNRIDVSAITDPQGQAVFNFNDLFQSGQAGFAVLDCVVNGTLMKVIQIEEEVTTEETITI